MVFLIVFEIVFPFSGDIFLLLVSPPQRLGRHRPKKSWIFCVLFSFYVISTLPALSDFFDLFCTFISMSKRKAARCDRLFCTIFSSIR